MKPSSILVIRTHSFVDLITNSSSELFVCDTDKTVEAVREVLVELATQYNAKLPLATEGSDLWWYRDQPIDLDRLFDDVFNDPYVSDGSEAREFGNYYDVRVSKGDIVIPSSSDNTIPYPLFDEIEQVLNARRYHLG